MECSVSQGRENGLETIVLKDPSGETTVSIVPAYGALLHAFVVPSAAGPWNIIDNYSNGADLAAHLGTSYKSSKLSPFVCRIAGGKYRYDGEVFEFGNKFLDGSAIHGLLYNKAFRHTDSFADEQQASASFRYRYNEEDDGYPFKYSCSVRYTLLPAQTLQVKTTILNLDDLPIPIADGWHPYFTLGGRVNDWQLYIGADQMLEFDEKLIPTGNLVPYDQFASLQPIGSHSFDNCFLLHGDESMPAARLFHAEAKLQLDLFADASYPYLQLFTPDHRKSIAIENLSAAPDAFNNQMGLLMLPPRHTHDFTVHYRIKCG